MVLPDSIAILSLPALYSLFDMASAMAPELNVMLIAIATALMLNVFIFVPSCDENGCDGSTSLAVQALVFVRNTLVYATPIATAHESHHC